MNLKWAVDLIGWVGAAVLLAAYAMVSTKKLEGDAKSYQWLNLVGGACLIVNTMFYGAYPSSLVNLVWIAIAIVTLRRVR